MTTSTIAAPAGDNQFDALVAMLRNLRLRSMAEELPALLDEASREGWGQIAFLCELFHREEIRKRQRRFERNFKASGLSACYGVEHFNFELAHAHGLEPRLARDLLECAFVRARKNLVLAGGVGTGKTFLARTIGVEALKRGFKVQSYYTAELLALLYSKRESFEFGKVYTRIRDVDVLILDDLAYLPYSPEKVEYLFSLVFDRYELQAGSTIVTSNTDVTDWWQFFPSKAMGMAFSDRLLDGARGIRFTGESIRTGRRPPNDPRPPAQPGPPQESP